MSQASRHVVTADADVRHRHVPQRTCVGCRRTRAKTRLLRLAGPDAVRFDERQVLPGRGTYVCADPRCVDAAARRDGHAVRRALRGGHSRDITRALAAARAHAVTRTSMDGTHHEEHTA